MASLVHFEPRHERDARANLNDFICLCRNELTAFGSDVTWDDNYWPQAKVTFGNLDKRGSARDSEHLMCQPFRDFAKAYFRYKQSLRRAHSHTEMRALKCVERALHEREPTDVSVGNVNSHTLDRAAELASQYFSDGLAYRIGGELERLAKFLSEKRLISRGLPWKNNIRRPNDTVRTGRKAKAEREKRLPQNEAIDALANIFASNPTDSRDQFTTSVVALLLCAPSRISEVLSLKENCEVTERRADGEMSYGWGFIPAKGGAPMTKWIPTAMVDVAKEAVARIRGFTSEARAIAHWYETNSVGLYRYASYPDVPADEVLSLDQVAAALGYKNKVLKNDLHRYGLNPDELTLQNLDKFVRTRLPKNFPWFDVGRRIKYSEALFCMQRHQLHAEFMTSSVLLANPPTNNLVNFDLATRETKPGYFIPSIFARHGYKGSDGKPMRVTTHQFRHLLNTLVQRGGLSQAEIAQWSGRASMTQNRVYDHMDEFELLDRLRSSDSSLSLDVTESEVVARIRELTPMKRQQFNTLESPNAHITRYGYCLHDFVMSPCQRFRDCLTCTEHACVKGDKRLEDVQLELAQVVKQRESAEAAMEAGYAGADRWYEVHLQRENILRELHAVLSNDAIESGTVITVNNPREYGPFRRAMASHKQLSSDAESEVEEEV